MSLPFLYFVLPIKHLIRQIFCNDRKGYYGKYGTVAQLDHGAVNSQNGIKSLQLEDMLVQFNIQAIHSED